MNKELLTTPPTPPPVPALQRADDVEELPLDFLVPGWLPLDSVTILWGDAGIGKTMLWSQLVADLTTGKPTIFEQGLLNPPEREPVTCLFLSGEDAFDRVLKTRLRKAGADLSRVFGMGQESEQVLDVDLLSPELDTWLAEYKPALLVLDSLRSFMPPGFDENRAQDVRKVIQKAGHLAGKHGCAVLIIHHSNKTTTAEKGRQAMSGSGDIYAAARSVIMVDDTGKMYDQFPEHFVRLDKANYCAPQPTILYHISDNGVCYDGVTEKSFAQLRADWRAAQGYEGRAAPRLEEAKEEILDHLQDGDFKVGDLQRRLREDFGTTPDTFQRAKKELIADGKLFAFKVGKVGQRGTDNYLTVDRQKAFDAQQRRKNRKP